MVGKFIGYHPQINALLETNSAGRLMAFLAQQKKSNKIIFPAQKNWFKAFELTPFNEVKVIILGQDPYHSEGQAQGLSFSVADGMKIPPSLRNIYQELELDLGIPANNSGNLKHWATQGVLLLNSVLTVEKNSPGSHANSGWIDFTDGVIHTLSEEKENLIFMLWGSYAQQKVELIDANKHLILTATHPSPFSAHKGFFGCKHFSKANDYLKIHKQKPIDW
ncbi:uracil-DNA glycosylase [endosymbiont of Bathymodiolus septemdierum str. Myojin knoll]|uniref:Uracil-DNA glycosylase n=1 Tax=endosymbiont of Bathymodiolus septemdierum str. Myojin knoll TaxID=1303921 RepID=A0A0P0URJ7_9GAMM|nr:uracil-DNA glycosylase [Bathymodiolus septemdierum thioautotrophic gill symbiont]BAS67465.1 uracil-DNA glycosylase [endosymbiont of Bathymodiolus septemdierum str. Myojin knoll]